MRGTNVLHIIKNYQYASAEKELLRFELRVISVMDVFKYLEEKGGDENFYLKALNLSFAINNIEEDMSVFYDLGSKLENIPGAYKKLLDDKNWRPQVVAYMCLMTTKNRGFFDELRDAFLRSSWISPQLAVAMYWLHSSKLRVFCENYLAEYERERIGTEVGALIPILPLCGLSLVKLPSKEIITEYFLTGIEISKTHMKFWNDKHGFPVRDS